MRRLQAWHYGGLAGLLALGGMFYLTREEAPLRSPAQRTVYAAGAAERSRYEEYEEVLHGKGGRLQEQTQRTAGGMLHIPKAEAPTAKAPPAALPDFFSLQGAPLSKAGAAKKALFLAARVYQQQRLKEGDGVVVQLLEGVQGWPAGTLLFGSASFAGKRLLLHFSVAEYEGERGSVGCRAYDKDFLVGLAWGGLQGEEHGLQRPVEKLAAKALQQVDKKVVQDWGEEATTLLKQLYKRKIALLEDGRIVYIKLP